MTKSTFFVFAILLGLMVFQATALYSEKSKVVKLTTKNFKSQVIDSKEVWLVEFYGNTTGSMEQSANLLSSSMVRSL